jgi:hypothetical protein
MACGHGFSIKNALIVMMSTSVLIVAAHAEPGPDAWTTMKAQGQKGKAGAVEALRDLVGVIQLTAATNVPKVGARWPYTVRAAACTRGAAAKLTAEVVDPIGRKHAVCFGTKPGEVKDISFTGTFKDFIVWPSKSVGYPLTLRITVVAGGATQTVDYKFTVQE